MSPSALSAAPLTESRPGIFASRATTSSASRGTSYVSGRRRSCSRQTMPSSPSASSASPSSSRYSTSWSRSRRSACAAARASRFACSSSRSRTTAWERVSTAACSHASSRMSTQRPRTDPNGPLLTLPGRISRHRTPGEPPIGAHPPLVLLGWPNGPRSGPRSGDITPANGPRSGPGPFEGFLRHCPFTPVTMWVRSQVRDAVPRRLPRGFLRRCPFTLVTNSARPSRASPGSPSAAAASHRRRRTGPRQRHREASEWRAHRCPSPERSDRP